MADSTLIPRPGDNTNVLLRKIADILLSAAAGNGGATEATLQSVLAVSDESAASLQSGLGAAGFDVVDDTDPHTGDWVCIHALEDSELSAVTATGSSGSLAGKTLLAGDRIFGPITAVTLTSGTVILYKAV